MMDRWKRLVPPAAGVVFVAVVAVSLALGSTPSTGATGAKVLSYYEAHKTRINVTVLLLGYSAVLGVVFYAGLASYLRRRGSEVLATIVVVGAGIMATGIAVGAGASAALTDSTRKLDPSAAQALNQIQNDIFFIALFAGLALATMAIGVAILRTKAMPTALGVVTVIVGVGALSGVGSWFAFLASGVLTLVLAGYLYERTGHPEEIRIPEIPAPARRPDIEAATSTPKSAS